MQALISPLGLSVAYLAYRPLAAAFDTSRPAAETCQGGPRVLGGLNGTIFSVDTPNFTYTSLLVVSDGDMVMQGKQIPAVVY